MRFVKNLFAFVLVLSCMLSRNRMFAQEYPITFKHISYREGLSQSPIVALFQDKKGFVWIGNREGLLRYDGYEFKTYSHKEEDSQSLSNNQVRTIAQDHSGKLWVGTTNGLNVLDPITDKFKYLDISEKKTVAALLVDRRDMIWIASYNGLKCLNSDGRQQRLSYIETDEKLRQGTAKCLMQDREGLIWVGFAGGLKCIDPRQRRTVEIPAVIDGDNVLKNASISSIKEDPEGDLWFATEDKGFFWYDKRNDKIWNYKHTDNSYIGLPSDVIKDILLFDRDQVWLGTRMGLSIFNKRLSKFTNYVHNSSDERSLSHNSIWSFLRDKSGNVWMGTYAGGINIYYPALRNFGNIGEKVGNNIGLSQPVVNSIIEDIDGALWIATDGGGLNYVNRKTKQSRFFNLQDRNRNRISHIVKTIAKTSSGKFFIGTLEGLGTFDVADGTIDYLSIDQNIPRDRRRVNALLADGKNMWAGMHSSGLYHILANGEIESFKYVSDDENTLSSNYIRCLVLDGQKGVWVGTGNGLNYYDKNKASITRYKSFEQKMIISMLIDSKGRLWVGTEKGIALFNPKLQKTEYINESDGLISEIIEAIVEDSSGKIWVSTPKGIASLELRTQSRKIERPNLMIHNYTSSDGLSSNQFLPGAALKTKVGELLFGGVNGLTTFFPDKIIKNIYHPNVVFTEFFIHNKAVSNNQNDSPLTLPIDDTKDLMLSYEENSISFKVAALNYINVAKNTYAYMLEGFDKDWHYVVNQRIINYTGLQPGNYTLLVKAANSDEVWSDTTRKIAIKVLPPFWRTWWAFFAYFVIFLSLLWLFNSYAVKAERFRHALDLESINHAKDQELAQRKMSFFTNISHEIKTPITMILAPVEQILNSSELSKNLKLQLQLVYNNGERLKMLVNQLLDFRKFDSDSDMLNLANNDIVALAKEIILAFKGLAETRKINIDFVSELGELFLWFDKDKLEKVLFNLLANAIKFTKPHHTVTIYVEAENYNNKLYAVIKVDDNGCGIDPDHLPHIFEPYSFYNTNGLNNEGTGLGLSFSKSLVQMHNGEIFVSSRRETEQGAGYTSFKVMLPFEGLHLQGDNFSTTLPNTDSDAPIPNVSARKSHIYKKEEILAGIGKDKPLLLIVEDNDEVREFLITSFEGEFEIISAVNGEDGVEKGLSNIPDVVISDVMMPLLDGIGLCSKLKSDVRTSHIPIILLTARDTTLFKVEGFDIGADDYVTKPFVFSLLKTRVWNLLYARQQLRSKFQREIILQPENVALNGPDDYFLMTLMNYIETHISDPDLTIDDLCREVAMARGTFYKKIKALTNQTANDFIRSIRLKRAAQLLEAKKHNVNEVAYLVGFSDVNHFRKCFKDQFGITPKDYGKQTAL